MRVTTKRCIGAFIVLAVGITSATWGILCSPREPDVLTSAEMNAIRGMACRECVAGWVSIDGGFSAGIECEHGPEHDPDCPPLSEIVAEEDCWEMNGHKGNCKCFECGLGSGCEGEGRAYRAWCGLESSENCGTCDSEDDTTGPLIQWRSATVEGGGACDWYLGYSTWVACGRGYTDATGCTSTNCTGQGEWTTVSTGMRKKCAD
jgi:hypothetical protein